MVRKAFRRIAGVAALIGLAVASSPHARTAAAAPASVPVATASHAAAPAPVEGAQSQAETGRGWGGMIGCAACLVGAGIVVAGGPASIIAAVYTPGSAIAALACAATCYEAFE